MRQSLTYVLVLVALASRAQVDTINTDNLKLNVQAFREGRSSYVVFFEDSLGNRISSADIWDRTIKFSTDLRGQKTYHFGWQAWRKDSLMVNVHSTGLFPSLKPLTHDAEYTGRMSQHYVFNNELVTVPDSKRFTAKDSGFLVKLDPAAFASPMDLELLGLIQFKTTGQQFAMAFYEPGRPQSKYYPLTVTGKEDIQLPGGETTACWQLRIDDAPGSYATFWIADNTREVIKVREYFRGRYRYKVKIY